MLHNVLCSACVLMALGLAGCSSDDAAGSGGAGGTGAGGTGAGGSGGGGSGAGGGQATARFELGVVSEADGSLGPLSPPFYFETDTQALAQAARDAIGQPKHVSGCITEDSAPYNDPHWKFMFVKILDFAELSAEVCDANIAETNADWPGYFSGAAPCADQGVQLCMWGSRVLAEVK